jgi:hypothetical protein
MYIEPYAMTHHFNYCKLRFARAKDVEQKYYNINDYDGQKATGSQSSVMLLKRLARALSCDEHYNPTKLFESPQQRDKLFQDYLITFNKNRCVFGKKRNQPYASDWKKVSDLTRDIGRALKDLVGTKNVATKRMGGGKDKAEDRANKHTLLNTQYHVDLITYRRASPVIQLFDDDEE